jgi:hypothetical protein
MSPVITTLHGTDITLSAPIARTQKSSASASSNRTARPPSRPACVPTHYRELGVTREIRVIPNFIDTDPIARDASGPAIAAGAGRRKARHSRVEFPAREAGRGSRGVFARSPSDAGRAS